MKRIFKWEWPSSASNIQPAVLKFKHYLQDNGFRASVIEGYNSGLRTIFNSQELADRLKTL